MHEDDRNAAAGTAGQPRAVGAWVYFAAMCLLILASFVVNMRVNGVFACGAEGYRGGEHYLGYCEANAYGDYDHGAFWFDLEPQAIDSARAADVLFLGNSRTEMGFSTPAIGRWFAEHDFNYYLLGFSHSDNAAFIGPLLENLHPRARVYVINADWFFVDNQTPPAHEVMSSPQSRQRYQRKAAWQGVHRRICTSFPSICGNRLAFFRDRETGQWISSGTNGFPAAPINSAAPLDRTMIEPLRARGEVFLARLAVPRDCVILTYVPQPYDERALAQAVAAELGVTFISPELDGLSTPDSSHLNRESAERFSRAFIEAADPTLRRCLGAQAGPALHPEP